MNNQSQVLCIKSQLLLSECVSLIVGPWMVLGDSRDFRSDLVGGSELLEDVNLKVTSGPQSLSLSASYLP